MAQESCIVTMGRLPIRLRVAILYGGPIFVRRQCYHLVYESQREQPHRAMRRTRKIRMKLGGSQSLDERFPAKPRGCNGVPTSGSNVKLSTRATVHGLREYLSCFILGFSFPRIW